MSTKALRQMIEAGKAEVLPLSRVVREALAEVEAIEKAARIIVMDDTGDEWTMPEERVEAGYLMERIAKESTT